MIFNGIEFLFFILGGVTTAGTIGLVFLHIRKSLNWKGWLSGILELIVTIFTIAWTVSSILEGEPQAASMGLIFFGIPAILLGLIFRKFYVSVPFAETYE